MDYIPFHLWPNRQWSCFWISRLNFLHREGEEKNVDQHSIAVIQTSALAEVHCTGWIITSHEWQRNPHSIILKKGKQAHPIISINIDVMVSFTDNNLSSYYLIALYKNKLVLHQKYFTHCKVFCKVVRGVISTKSYYFCMVH